MIDPSHIVARTVERLRAGHDAARANGERNTVLRGVANDVVGSTIRVHPDNQSIPLGRSTEIEEAVAESRAPLGVALALVPGGHIGEAATAQGRHEHSFATRNIGNWRGATSE